jgi:hypothetical protein
MPRQQRFHACMAAVAIAAGVAQVPLGSAGLAMTFAPLLLIAVLLMSWPLRWPRCSRPRRRPP